jgi:hypothetical protein
MLHTGIRDGDTARGQEVVVLVPAPDPPSVLVRVQAAAAIARPLRYPSGSRGNHTSAATQGRVATFYHQGWDGDSRIPEFAGNLPLRHSHAHPPSTLK